MIIIWFSDEDDGQNVTDPLIQTTHVDSNIRHSSGMSFYTRLRNKTISSTYIAWIQTELWEQKGHEKPEASG